MNIANVTLTSRTHSLLRVRTVAGDLDRTLATMLRPVTLPAMRLLLGILFVWFGALKVAGTSPVADVVAGTLPWADPHLTVLALGAAEVAFGIALVSGVLLRLVLPLLAAHLVGTFLTFVMLPGLMFRGDNPLLLTETGEFVAKNLVLIAATLVLICHTGATGGAAAAQTPQAPADKTHRQADAR